MVSSTFALFSSYFHFLYIYIAIFGHYSSDNTKYRYLKYRYSTIKEDINTISHHWHLGKPAQQMYQAIKEVYQDDCLGRSTILRWHNFFTKGRELAALEPHGGQPASIVTETNISTVAVVIKDDCHMSVRMLETMASNKIVADFYLVN